MTAVQPRLVRADTLDLQSPVAPSAKDHARSPTLVPYSHGAAGSHHREALRNAEESAYNERKSSPRMSMEESSMNGMHHAHQYDSTDEDGDDEHDDVAHHDRDEYDDGNDENDDDLEDDLLDKISSSPSIEDEDIDFEFVYALHTFVATVEGQANATKGDTMVLLDDSNSYWWLVRVVKDGSIGYLPAEHIETPTERLARLNKHRNIDLSASMLGDNPDRSRNPLKKAMRRRNAKTVAFAAPTYYEPSEYEYTSDEDEDEGAMDSVASSQHQSTQQTENGTEHEAQQAIETQDDVAVVNGIKKVTGEDHVAAESPTSPVHAEASQTTLSQPQLQTDENMQRSRNGVVRNTDSFFKDDTAETKKISLTPRLLRNDTESANTTDPDLRSKSSADTFEKVLGTDEKSKEKEKEKKKEKKGMLSGLFKRKDKSSKNAKSDTEDDKIEDTGRGSQTKENLEPAATPQSPEKKTGKLQKQQPQAHMSPKNSPTELKSAPNLTSASTSPMHSPKLTVSSTSLGPQRDEHDGQQTIAKDSVKLEQAPNRFPSLTEKRSIFAPITTVLKTTPSSSTNHDPAVKPVYSKRAKERFAIDASDSEDDPTPTTSQTSPDHRPISPIRNSQIQDSRPDSAMEVSPVEPSDNGFNDEEVQPTSRTPTNIETDHDSHGPLSDTASTSKPSPSLATHTPSTSRSTPTWSDASLRSYMESDQDIRDLLIIVHDKSSVTPVGPDHPLMGGLFMTERTRLAEMQTQLDTMLTAWISKKNPGLLSR